MILVVRQAGHAPVLSLVVGGDAGIDAPVGAVLPGSQRRALHVEARPRALALLDQHRPVLAARAALPDDRPQR